MRRILFGVAAVLAGLIVALVLGEIALRLANRPAPEVIGWTGDGGPGAGSARRKNELGFRGHHRCPVPRSYRPAGGFTGRSRGNRLPRHARSNCAPSHGTFQRRRHRRVQSLGWDRSELLALQTYLDAIHPTEVVLWFTEANDLWNNTFPTHLPKDGFPKPTFWLEGAELKGPNLFWLVGYRPPGLYLTQAIHRVQGLSKYPTEAAGNHVCHHVRPPFLRRVRARWRGRSPRGVGFRSRSCRSLISKTSRTKRRTTAPILCLKALASGTQWH